METTILVAKIFAVYLVVSGLFLIIRGKTIPNMLRDFYDHPAMCYLTGIILIFLSSMYLIQFNSWSGTWLQIVVNVFVWLIMIKGLAYIFVPKLLSNTVVKKFRTGFAIYGVIAILIGVYIFFWI